MLNESNITEGTEVIMRSDLTEDQFTRVGLTLRQYTPGKRCIVTSIKNDRPHKRIWVRLKGSYYSYPIEFFDDPHQSTVLLSKFLLNNK